jgi:hypothetical protein
MTWTRPKRGPMPPAQRARLSAAMAAHWAAKRGEETPEAAAKREAMTAYQRLWRQQQAPEWRAQKAAYLKAWRERKRRKAAK